MVCDQDDFRRGRRHADRAAGCATFTASDAWQAFGLGIHISLEPAKRLFEQTLDQVFVALPFGQCSREIRMEAFEEANGARIVHQRHPAPPQYLRTHSWQGCMTL